jgi:hypothetical protein
MSLIALSLIGVTVHFWNVLYAFFFFFIGIGGWLADPKPARATAKSRSKRHRTYTMPFANSPSYPAGAWPQPA